ncbi:MULTISPECIES: hypothetical protein [Thioclava]|uniref:Uncharacterized protein n=1 Tax=Thioclava kandeliae TaxID=3070818 RepID=A0ABV1SJH6_9RHOB
MGTHISKEFAERIDRIARTHKAGGGFEAVGALGRLDQVKPQSSRRISLPLKALVFLFLGFFLFKGAMIAQMGEQSYLLRLTTLKADGGFDAAVALVMAPDTLSHIAARFISQLLG